MLAVEMAVTCFNCSNPKAKSGNPAFQPAYVRKTTPYLASFQSFTKASYHLSSPIALTSPVSMCGLAKTVLQREEHLQWQLCLFTPQK